MKILYWDHIDNMGLYVPEISVEHSAALAGAGPARLFSGLCASVAACLGGLFGVGLGDLLYPGYRRSLLGWIRLLSRSSCPGALLSGRNSLDHISGPPAAIILLLSWMRYYCPLSESLKG